jgi:DNA-binding beta-propeller fold protein YncE
MKKNGFLGLSSLAWSILLGLLFHTSSYGQIYVTNYQSGLAGTGTVTKLSGSGSVIGSPFISGLYAPYDVAISGNDLFISNTGSGGTGQSFIGKYTSTGSTVNASLVTGLSGAYGLAVSGNNLFVTNDNKVGLYDATTGAAINSSLITTGLTGAFRIVLTADNLYVVSINGSDGIVGKYTLSGGIVNASLVSGLGLSYGMAVAGNRLYVTNYLNPGAGTVGVYDATTGSAIDTSFITGLSGPLDITEYGGVLYVLHGGGISKYDSLTGTPMGTFSTTGGTPTGIAIVPEPSTTLLIALGLPCLFWYRRHLFLRKG